MFHPIDQNKSKCRISEGCFYAIGSYAKHKLEKVSYEDDAGTDFRLIKQKLRNGRICDMGCVLEFQVKSTSNYKLYNGYITYKLSSKNYNDIVTRNIEGGTPLVLILMLLPKDEDKWIRISDRSFKIQKNFYWIHIDSKILLKNENSSKTIKIPKLNLLTKDSFNDIVNLFSIKAKYI